MNRRVSLMAVWVALVPLLGGLLGCDESGNGSPALPISTLYVSDTSTDDVTAWDTPALVDGDTAPDRTIGGMTADITDPYGISYDSRGDTLLVGSLGNDSIRFYDGVSSTDGDVAPSRILAGDQTELDGGEGYITAVDETRDILYVSVQNGILVFVGAAALDGNVAPTRTLEGAATLLDNGNRDKRLFIDEAADRLYVADEDHLLVFDAVSTLDGNVAPSREVVGASTGFDFLWGIAVDVNRDIVYLADESASAVFIYDDASTIDGDVAPDRVLQGALSELDSPADIFLDPVTDTLYVTNYPSGGDGGISIWANASQADGDLVPDRMITGAATGLAGPTGVTGAR